MNINKESLLSFLLTLADDELILGHRNAEWTGYAPLLEEDIAFSNISQDELGHALALYTLCMQLGVPSPDVLAFERAAQDFRCCRFVTYPKGDFAYTVVRQFLYDTAEQVRLQSLRTSAYTPLKEIAEKMLLEEHYHFMHSKGLVERLGNATEESHQRMQAAAVHAFSQALGIFEVLENEQSLIDDNVFVGNIVLKQEWLNHVVPLLKQASLDVPADTNKNSYSIKCIPDEGGRRGLHTEHLPALLNDMQQVYRLIPNARW